MARSMAARQTAHEAREGMMEELGEDGSAEQDAAELSFNGQDEDEEETEDERHERLIAILRAEESGSLGNDGDDIASDQIAAFDRYLGKDYGDEIEGASRVHTREVFETIEAMRPKFKRMFGRGAKSITVEPWAEGEEAAKQAQDAQDYLRAVLFGDPRQLDGHAIFDDFFFDGALQKIGVGCVAWEEAELGPPISQDGLLLEQVQLIEAEAQKDGGKFELLEVTPNGMGPEGVETFTVKVQKVMRPAKAVIEIIAPEDFRVSKTATDLEDPPYCGHLIRKPMSRVKAMFPDKAEAIDEAGSGESVSLFKDDRRQARFWDIDDGAVIVDRQDGEELEVELLREFIRFDYDGDGYPELVECWRIGDLLLDCEQVEENPYFYWTPIRIPHRLVGLSIADIESDIQRTNTVHLRNANNSSALAVAPRKVVHPGHVNMPDLLNVSPGAIIRMNQQSTKLPGEVIKEEVTVDQSASALRIMEKMDRLSERRTGVTEHMQGMNPDVLNETMGGIELLQASANERIECYGEAMAAGLGPGLTKFLRLHVAHAQGERKLNVSARPGKASWKTFNPSTWAKDLKVVVQSGQGSGNRQARIAQLMGISQKQDAIILRYGIGNPIVTPKHWHNTIEQICREMGFLSADEFFADPASIDPQAMQAMMQPPPDPKAQEAQAKAQLAMAELQQDMKQFMMKAQQDMQQFMVKLQAETQAKREQMATEAQLSMHETAVNAAARAHSQPAPVREKTRLGGDKV